jgi:GT2 family glycosyltransferase
VKIDVSIVVCTFNRADMLRRALESLLLQETGGEFTFEVVVVDDGSTDSTQVVLRKIAKGSQVPIRCFKGEGRGIAAARNLSVSAASGEWLAFFDDDQIAEPNWVRELLALAVRTRSKCLGGARPLMLTAQELSRLSLVSRGILGEIAQGSEPVRCARTQYPCTGNMLLRRSVFEQVGGFDESLARERGGEDTEFTARLRRAGVEAWFAPMAIVHHHVPQYRLNEAYLFWRSLGCGDNFAYRDFTEWGLARTLAACAARIGQACLINSPLILFAHVLRNRAEVIARKCLLLGAWGYLRQSLYLVSPRLFSQEAYFSRLSFRTERSAFAGCSNPVHLTAPEREAA